MKKEVAEIKPAQTIVSATEVLADDFDIRSEQLEKQIEEKYNEEWVSLFKRLAYELTVIGMQLKEACLVVGIEYEKLVILMKSDPLIERLIQTKDLEYKRSLLKTVSAKAKNDDKQAQWLLQARYPNEFNPRKGSAQGNGEGEDDILGVAIEFIQKSGDNTPLVEKHSKVMVVKTASSEKSEMMKKISQVLK